MDQLIGLLTKKTVIGVIVALVLITGIAATVYLSQRPTQLKSKAASPEFGSIAVSTTSINKTNGNWESIPITVNISVPGADNSRTVAGVFVNQTQNVSSGAGWVAIGHYYGSNGVDSFSWTPPSNYAPGSFTFGLFLMDNNSVLDIINTSEPVEFRSSINQICTPNQWDSQRCARCSTDGTFWGANGSDFGLDTGSAAWCSCAERYAPEYQTSPTYGICRGSNTICSPNQFDPNLCRRCSTDGTFWGAAGSDFGPQSNQTQWCTCAQNYASDYQSSRTYDICRGSGGPGTVCTPGVFDSTNCRKCSDDGTFWGNNCTDYGLQSNQTQWCACGQKCAPDYSTSLTYAVCRTSGTVCTPGSFDVTNCRKCADDGSFWGQNCTDYGLQSNQTQWCGCGQKCASDFSTSPTYDICRGGAGAADASECRGVVFKKDGQVVSSSTALKTGQTYNVEITMDNKDSNNTSYVAPTWTVGNLSTETGYFLGFPTANDKPVQGDVKYNVDTAGTGISINSLWQVNWPDSTKLRIPVGTNVPSGGSYTFKFQVTPQQAGTHTFYWGMIHEGITWFGGQCVPTVNVEGSTCPKPGEAGATKTCGVDTYDTCVDDKGLLSTGNTSSTFCKTGATNFRCYYSGNPNICISGASASDLNYSCSACTTGGPACSQVVTRARNTTTNECKDFPTTCLDPGWVADPNCTPTTQIGTQCYIMTEDPAVRDALTNCNNAQDTFEAGKPVKYRTHPTNISYTFKDQTPGVKFIFVRFISSDPSRPLTDGDFLKRINFAPSSAITGVDCHYSPTGTGTDIVITGTNLGSHTQQGAGGITVNGQKVQTTWTNNQSPINTSISTRPEGEITVVVKPDDGPGANGRCNVNLTTVTFDARNQCNRPGNLESDNVDVKLFDNNSTNVNSPLVSQKIRLDKDGNPSNFAPKVEVGKAYTLVIKAPQTVARKVEFIAQVGTTNIPNPVVLPAGDISGRIAGVSAPDGFVNSDDYSKMVQEWVLTKDVTRVADLNKDRRVNSADWACMRPNFLAPNNQDEVFNPATTRLKQVNPSPSSLIPQTTTSSPSPTASPVSGIQQPFSSANAFRDYIMENYGFTSNAASFIRNNSSITVNDLNGFCGGGGGWIPTSKSVELNCAQHEAAVHELSHVWWNTQRIQNPDMAKGLAKDLVRLADGDGSTTASSFAKTYVYGTTDWKGMYCTNNSCADVHNILDSDFDLTQTAINAKINDWEIYAGLSSWMMGRYKSGSRALPNYLWRYFEPQFSGIIQLTPYYDGGHA